MAFKRWTVRVRLSPPWPLYIVYMRKMNTIYRRPFFIFIEKNPVSLSNPLSNSLSKRGFFHARKRLLFVENASNIVADPRRASADQCGASQPFARARRRARIYRRRQAGGFSGSGYHRPVVNSGWRKVSLRKNNTTPFKGPCSQGPFAVCAKSV